MSDKPIIKLTLDPDNLPPLTQEQIAMFDELDAMPDSEIDYSDIPHHDFLNRPAKKMTTVRIDVDVLSWLKSFGKGYQSRINAILRHEMLSANKPKV